MKLIAQEREQTFDFNGKACNDEYTGMYASKKDDIKPYNVDINKGVMNQSLIIDNIELRHLASFMNLFLFHRKFTSKSRIALDTAFLHINERKLYHHITSCQKC